MKRHAERRDHDRELAHLGEVDGGHDARSQPQAQRVKDRDDHDAADDHKDRGGEGKLEHRQARNRDLHAEGDEEQGHEKVADAHRLGDDVDVIRKCGKTHAGDQSPHLPRETDQAGGAGQEEAPAQRRHQHELGCFGHGPKQVRQYVFRERETADHEHRAAPQRAQQGNQVWVQQIRLHREHPDRPQVLDDEHAQRDAPRQGVELELVIENLDHDQRAREAHACREIEQSVVMRRVLDPEHGEESESERDADRHLEGAGKQDGRAA